jgi:hypothetical protein
MVTIGFIKAPGALAEDEILTKPQVMNLHHEIK